jgi:hypothetical protein
LANFRGIDIFKQRLGQLPDVLLDKAGKALYQEALIMKATSMERTPVRHGTLKASHDVTEPERDGASIKISITVGGPAAPYAYFVHENLESNHSEPHRDPEDGKMYTCGGQAKFLESSVREAIDGLDARLAERMK